VGVHAACGSGRFWEFGLVEIKIPSLRRERERLVHPALRKRSLRPDFKYSAATSDPTGCAGPARLCGAKQISISGE
jgi:hypothetical protein